MVGRHVLRLLDRKGIPRLATSRRAPRHLYGASWSAWDLQEWRSTATLDHDFPGVGAVIHLAAVVPNTLGTDASSEIFDVNVRGTACIAQWALQRNLPLVYLSSATVYADPQRAGIVESDDTIRGAGEFGFYALSKLLAEEALRCLAPRGAPLCILRPSSIYGAGLPAGKMIPKFLRQAAAGQCIEIGRPEDDRVDLIHADDVAAAMLFAVEREASGVFNIASEAPATIAQIAQACVDAVGAGSVRVVGGPAGRAPQTRFALRCRAAREGFGFASQLDLLAGLKRMWNDVALM